MLCLCKNQRIMLTFNKLDDFTKVKEYMNGVNAVFSDFSQGFHSMWSDKFSLSYAVYDDTLILCFVWRKFCFYTFPVGKNIDGALTELENYCQTNHLPLQFSPLCEKEVEYLKKRYPFTTVEYNRAWSDYIYNAEDMKYFKGKKFSGQRNHVNKFKSLYGDYEFEEITPLNLQEVISFLKEYGLNTEFLSASQKDEYERCFLLLNDFSRLNLVGGVVRYNGQIICISIGEKVKDTLVIHVEKGYKNYQGVYQIMVSEFAKRFASEEIKFINREDDSGNEGLRTSKMQYQPIEIMHKNHLFVSTFFDKIPKNVQIIDENLKIDDITANDKSTLFSLATDETLNEFWGYDYKEHLKSPPTEEYFVNFVDGLKKIKEEYSVAVRLDGKMIGEGVFHNLNFLGEVEVGLRLLPNFNGKGIGSKVFKMLATLATSLGAKKVKAKCFKQNLRSKKALENAGFTKTHSSDEYFYFKYN